MKLELNLKVIFTVFFCCFDKGNLVVLFNGFQKKTQKTLTNELKRALKIMEEYFNEQNESKNGNKK